MVIVMKARSSSWDLRILFKKFYCPECGERLKVVKKRTLLTETEKKDFYKRMFPHGIPFYLDVVRQTQMFRCPRCNYYNTTDNQLLIYKKQKQLNMKIVTVTDEEIRQTYKNQMLIAQQNILKLRWTLLIPVVGSFICTFCITNGKLSEMLDEREFNKIILWPLFIFLAVYLISGFVLSRFNDIELINNYFDVFVLIPSSLSANIPILRYINRTFKD